ncbi:MAG: IPTL-CTERM sorting domain-containing protein [Pseudomonadota bacterium]|nr:IPTL-CTERM sorting domain-containing protein [Pseudomonadota bacterium]
MPLTARSQIGVTGDATINRCETESYTISVTNDFGNDMTNLVVVAKLENLQGFSYVNGTSSIDINGGGSFCTNNPVMSGGYAGSCFPAPNAPYLIWNIDLSCGNLVLNNGDTLNIAFQLETDCTAVSGSLNTFIDYRLSGTPMCDDYGGLNIQVNPGAVTIKMTPNLIPQVLGQNVTWTLTVENTGFGVIENVEVTDQLGAGLVYLSATENGNNSGQTTTWTGNEYAALASMNPGDILTMDISATLVACENLDNSADVRFGCAPSPVATCFDSSVDGGTARASVQRIVRTPYLSFTPPDVNFTYCNDTDNVSFAITNSGDGIASDVYVLVDFSGFTVSNVSAGASYNTVDKRFELVAPIAVNGDPGDSYNLSFDLIYTTWCGATFPAGDLLWQKRYKDECGQEFYSPAELSSINTPASTPSLSVSKTGAPAVVQIGGSLTYTVSSSYSDPTSCGSGNAGLVTVVDTLPVGVAVTNAGGGIWIPGGGGTGGTITWTYTPPGLLDTSITVQAPDASQCATYCNTYLTNNITAAVRDCCGCELSDSDSQITAIKCTEGVASEKSSSSPTQRCADTTYTNTYIFPGDSGVLLSNLRFEEQAELQQAYNNGSLSINLTGSGDITGSVAVSDNTPGGSLLLDFSGSAGTSMAGETLTITYNLTATANTVAACGGTTFYSWSSLDLGDSSSSCLGDGIIQESTEVSIISPTMSLAVAGLGEIIHACEGKTISLTLTQTSTNANPKDVKLVLSGLNYYVVNPGAVNCSGDCLPVSCTPIIDGSGDYVWTFNDVFSGLGQSATLQLDVQKRCSGSGELKATAYYDDLCSDDANSDELCSVVAAETPVIILSGDLLIEKTPEIYYADRNIVQWEIYLTNRGTGTAYNVWVDDVLGSGLQYEPGVNPIVVDNMSGVTINDSLDHYGGAINGASVEITSMAAGERRQITFIANQIDCSNLTNDVTANWGCIGMDCQSDITDSSIVTNPTPNLINTTTIDSPDGVNACSSSTSGVITLRNSGQVTLYNLEVTETLPPHLTYVSGSTRWRLNNGAWNGPDVSCDPSPTTSPLVWSRGEITTLAVVNSGDTIEIEFSLAIDCLFTGGDITVSTQYENPCADLFNATVNRFTTVFNTPVIEVQQTRADDPIGCGESIQWTIDVTNDSGYTLPIIWVEESMGNAFTYTSSVGDPPYTVDDGTNVGQTVAWELKNVPHGTTVTLTLNATADSVPCSPDLTNSVTAYWGCGSADGSSATKPGHVAPDNLLCLSPYGFNDERTETREPDMSFSSIEMIPTSINSCAHSTVLTVVIENAGSIDAHNVDCVITLPSGLIYNNSSSESGLGADRASAIASFAGIANPSISGSVLTWNDIGDKGNDIADTIQADGGNDTLVLRFSVQSACYTTADLKFDLYYYDCCDANQYNVSSSRQLTALSPSLNLTQTPITSQVNCATPQPLTITVTNNGTGNAQVVRVEDRPGAWIDVRTGQSGDPIDMGGGVYGWEVNNLAAGGTAVFTLVGTLNPDNLPNQDDCNTNLRQNNVQALWACGVGAEAFDGDPTTQGYDCTSGNWVAASTATLLTSNLVITEITPEITCDGDGAYSGSITVRVQNQGDGFTSENFTVTITDDGHGWSGSGSYSGGAIGSGNYVDVTIETSTWQPNHGTTYTITAKVDSDDMECECQESDNTFTATAYTAQIPDLNVSDIDFTDVGCVGDAISGHVEVTVQNLGDATATAFQLSLITDGCLTFSNETVASLDAGAATTVNFDITNSWADCTVDECQFTATVDVGNNVCECDGSNNARVEVNPPFRAKLFWSDATGQTIQRADLDGGSGESVADVTDGLNEPRSVAVDKTEAKLYRVNGAAGTIQQSDLDGLNAQVVASALTSPMDIALDSVGGKMYWSDNGDNAIYRADLNGDNQETLISGLGGVGGLALDVGAGKLYWANPADGEIKRADLDGANPEVLIGAGLATPFGISLDLTGLKIYFSDPGSGKIQKADLDGANVEDVAVGLGADVRFMALDEIESLIYFSTNSTTIRSVGFDGTGLHEVVTGLTNAFGVALYTPVAGYTNVNLTVKDVTLAITCSEGDVVSGAVTVNVAATGSLAVDDVVVRVTSNCGVTFTDQIVNLVQGQNRNLIFNYTSDCSDCIFTAVIDPDNEICECDDTDNSDNVSTVNAENMPAVTTNSAGNVSSSGATLNGTVNACNVSTNITFEYGLDNSYGSSVTADQSPLTGMCGSPVNKLITGLLSDTTYHYRVVGVNGVGTANGANQTFTTSRNIGVIVSSLSSSTTDEGGAIATFTVVLNSQPGADVVIPLSSSDSSEGIVSPASLIFTSTNWNTAQTVTITGINDDLLDGDIAYTVEIGPADSSDSGYNGNDPAAKDLTNIDTDLDYDGDGISNEREGSGDRDGDGVPNFQDYDPSGYFYDSADGSIVSGGHIDVNGPGNVTFVSDRNGVSGYYQFIVDTPGTYSITVFPPSGYDIDSNCAELGTLAVTGNQNPYVPGSGENGSSGILVDFDCVGNPWYLTIDVQVSTALILNNNIPLHYNNTIIPTLNEWGMILSGCLLSLVALIVFRRRKKM